MLLYLWLSKLTPTEWIGIKCIYNTLSRLIFLNYQLNLGSIRNLQIFLTQSVCRRYCVQLAVSSMEVQMYTSEPFACSRGGRCTRTCRHRSPGGHPRVGWHDRAASDDQRIRLPEHKHALCKVNTVSVNLVRMTIGVKY